MISIDFALSFGLLHTHCTVHTLPLGYDDDGGVVLSTWETGL